MRTPKIFCIGFNKTGTSSLTKFFEQSGFKTVHNPRYPYYSHISLGKLYFRMADVFCDGERPNFSRLRQWFPEALFIFNDRSEAAWIRSRLSHAAAHLQQIERDERKYFDKRKYGAFVPGFKLCPESTIDYWVTSYRQYRRLVLTYFQRSDHFLHLYVTSDPQWEEKLVLFLNKNGVMTRETNAMAANITPKEQRDNVTLVRLLEYYSERWGNHKNY